MKQKEEGHAINIANFERLLACIEINLELYQPVDKRLLMPNLRQVLIKTAQANEAVNEALLLHKNNIHKRQEAFEPLNKLVTQVSGMMQLMPISEKTVALMKHSVKKMHGVRVSARISVEMMDNLMAQGKEVPVQVSAAQTGFENKVEHFEKMIKLLEITPEYKPNEPNLQLQTLKTMLLELKNKNSQVKYSYSALRKQRMERDKLLYDGQHGICQLAWQIKTYFKIVYGSKSAPCSEVVGIRFSKRKYNPVNQQPAHENQLKEVLG